MLAVNSWIERQKPHLANGDFPLCFSAAGVQIFGSRFQCPRSFDISRRFSEVDPGMQLETTCRRLPNPCATSTGPAERRVRWIPPLSVLVPAISAVAGPLTQAMPSVPVEPTLPGSARVGSLLHKCQADLPSKSLAEEVRPGALNPHSAKNH